MSQPVRDFLILLAVLAACVLAGPARGADSAIEITLEQQPDGAWRLRYALPAAQRRLDLGPSLGGARGRDWRVLTEGVVLTSEKGRDYLAPEKRGATLSGVDIAVTPRANGLMKDYETAAPLGAGAVLYTGHFIPFTENGWRADTVISVRPLKDGVASAFGETAPAFENWISPQRHPAFIYAGPPVKLSGGAFIDPSVNGWVKEETETLLPALFAWYAQAFAAPLERAPDMFLAMGDASEAGRLRYHGDALPGQFMITLSGGGWESPANGARELLRRGIAHEAAHLFQARARPSGGDAPDWIHEGAADALANEALEGIGLISRAEADAARTAARYECETELAGGSLNAAAAAGRWRAVYACGHALAVAAARAHNKEGSVALFWRDFLAASAANDGYDLSVFLSVIEAQDGDRVADGIRRFAYSRYAQPARELAKLAGE